MSAFLEVHGTRVAYSDPTVTNNPQRRAFDVSTHRSGLLVENPRSERVSIAPGDIWRAFQSKLTLAADDTTQYAITANPIKPGTYRLAWTGGTAPGFRVDRGLALLASPQEVVVAVNNNATATFGIAIDLTAVQVGDQLFIPGISTGDGDSPFADINCGTWVILGKSTNALVCRRPVGQVFEGISETVALTDASQFQAMSAAGAQAGDTLEIAGGFNPVNFGAYRLATVTAGWVEFVSGEPLALEADVIPGAAALVLYRAAKRYLYVETDQPALLTLNEATGITVRPVRNGDEDLTGWFELWGHVWACTVTNQSPTNTLSCHLLSAE